MKTATVYTFVHVQFFKLCGSSHLEALLLLLTQHPKLPDEETS